MFFGIIGDEKIPDIITSYYNYGGEDVEWVAGFSSGISSVSKNIDNLYLMAEDVGYANCGYVTNVVVDLTNISKLKIEWENTGYISAANESYLNVSTVKNQNHGTYNARLKLTNTFGKQISELDVSSLSGNYYIRVHAVDGYASGNRKSEIKVYSIKGYI
jgi:hypothetical protein